MQNPKFKQSWIFDALNYQITLMSYELYMKVCVYHSLLRCVCREIGRLSFLQWRQILFSWELLELRCSVVWFRCWFEINSAPLNAYHLRPGVRIEHHQCRRHAWIRECRIRTVMLRCYRGNWTQGLYWSHNGPIHTRSRFLPVTATMQASNIASESWIFLTNVKSQWNLFRKKIKIMAFSGSKLWPSQLGTIAYCVGWIDGMLLLPVLGN